MSIIKSMKVDNKIKTMNKKETKMDTWNFDNSYTSLPSFFYSLTNPTPVKTPNLVIFNESLANKLGINKINKNDDLTSIFAGNTVPNEAKPLAQAYAGHQFGHFTMLGDGRAILLGEQITPSNERFDIQLKGSGRTPYSRRGDGRATLGPMLREYIISETMFALGIPTTRSLAVVTTGENVYREHDQTGAILTRVAKSHIRVGTFQYAANWGTKEDVKALADYTIERHYPHIKNNLNKYLTFIKEVIKRQAELISKWQSIGFIHGVMNTDNMTISGETIDYGPCAFMDTYDPETVFSSIDVNGRYAYGNQPYIAAWNLTRFAETLLPLLHENQEQAIEIAQDAISEFPRVYKAYYLASMRHKIGLFNEEDEDEQLIHELLDIMYKQKLDYTNTFRQLTLTDKCGFSEDLITWYDQWQSRLLKQKEFKDECYELMKKSNPYVIPRNHRVEEALEAATKHQDYSVMKDLLKVLKHPFTYSSLHDEYTLPNESNLPYQTYCGT